jgi:hypothetical protein
MTPEELFTAALGLGRQWRVAQCRFEGEPKRLELRLEHVPGNTSSARSAKLRVAFTTPSKDAGGI